MKRAFACAAMTALLTLMSCTSTPPGPEPTDQANQEDSVAILRQRAEKLWTAKVNEDWATVFEFQDKNYIKDGTVEAFTTWSKEKEPFRIHSQKIERVLTDTDIGWVQVEIDTSMRNFPDTPHRTVERWEKWKRWEGVWIPVPLQENKFYPLPPVQRNTDEEPKLLARWKESWKPRQARDWKALYEFADPVDRETVTEAQFEEVLNLVLYVSAETQWVQVTGKMGIMQIAYRYKKSDPSLSKLAPILDVVGEEWVKRDNQWYLNLAPDTPAPTPAPASTNTPK